MPVSLNYLVKRAFWCLLVVLGVAIFTYLILILSPGDPAVKWAGNPRGPGAAAAIEAARRELGLNDPLYIQVARFVLNVITGNLGVSIAYKKSVSEVVLENLKATLELLFVTYLFATPLGVFLGYLAALRRGSRLDAFLQQLGVVLANIPSFWFGSAIFLALTSLDISVVGRVDYALAFQTNFQPITGFYLLDSLLQLNIPVFLDVLKRIIPSAIAIAGYPLGLMIRVTRTLVAEELLEDYINAAVALGVKRRTVLWNYVLRAIRPGVMQLAGMAFAYSVVDAMVVENVVFGRPGLGKLLIDALRTGDFRIAVGLVIVVSIFYLVINTISDIVQALTDPRVRI